MLYCVPQAVQIRRSSVDMVGGVLGVKSWRGDSKASLVAGSTEEIVDEILTVGVE
jgi:hypothetical protein